MHPFCAVATRIVVRARLRGSWLVNKGGVSAISHPRLTLELDGQRKRERCAQMIMIRVLGVQFRPGLCDENGVYAIDEISTNTRHIYIVAYMHYICDF